MIPKIAPSILAADFAKLGADIEEAEAAGADWVHVDVMDGHFVPNISIGVPVVRAIRPVTGLPLDVHLMISEPAAYITPFAEAGADHLTVHAEVAGADVLQAIKEAGCKAGMALNPDTPPEALREVMPLLDMVIVMSVHPGFGGQSFIEGSLEKIAAVRALRDALNPTCAITVDGGVGPSNAAACVRAGATVLVAGSAIFRSEQGVAEAIRVLKQPEGAS
jgi:ribulose-phosphate 3-epimerase